MSLLIKGMEMPPEGGYLSVTIYGNGTVVVPEQIHYPGTPHEPPKFYKAAPLPEGHGRLGDLDALQEEFKKFHDGKRLMLIDTAPTIVPTEGGNADGNP